MLVISGEAGIGKTRLTEEFLAYVTGLGAVTLAARCYEGESNIAYGPIVEALRAALRIPGSAQRLASMPHPWPGEVARLLPDLATTDDRRQTTEVRHFAFPIPHSQFRRSP